MTNIHLLNADGVEELLLIGTALKNARARYQDNNLDPSVDLIDRAITVVDRVFLGSDTEPTPSL